MQQSHEEDRGGGAGAGGAGAELDETPERSLTTEAVSEAKSFAPSSALASAGATCALYRQPWPWAPFVEKHVEKDGKLDLDEFSKAIASDAALRGGVILAKAFADGVL